MNKTQMCPNCDCEVTVRKVMAPLTLMVREEDVTVIDHSYQCPSCEAQWSIESFDVMKEVYDAYRERHHMVKTEELINWRESMNLTQSTLAEMLGWNVETLISYEHGCLQNEVHDDDLKAVMRDGLVCATKPHTLTSSDEEVAEYTIAAQQETGIAEWSASYPAAASEKLSDLCKYSEQAFEQAVAKLVAPSKEEIAEFLEILDRLCIFEADQFNIRGYGAFTQSERKMFPIKVVVKVKEWLGKIDPSETHKALRHIQSMAGAPDAAQACRTIIKRAQEAIEEGL